MAAKKQVTVREYPTEGLASVKDAARFLKVCDDTVYRMCDDGRLKKVYVGSAVRIPWQQLHGMLSGAK